ncbi:hypothetical protein HBH46_159340 [Parastagonospora nodorum]|nr:hypothetical protein HBH46_159340 [Parastagonospora nodorum]
MRDNEQDCVEHFHAVHILISELSYQYQFVPPIVIKMDRMNDIANKNSTSEEIVLYCPGLSRDTSLYLIRQLGTRLRT